MNLKCRQKGVDFFVQLKGLFTDFTWGVHGTTSGILFTLSIYMFPVAVMPDFMVSWIGPNTPLLL